MRLLALISLALLAGCTRRPSECVCPEFGEDCHPLCGYPSSIQGGRVPEDLYESMTKGQFED